MDIENKELYSDWFCTVGIGMSKGYYSDISGNFKWMSKEKALYVAKKLNNDENTILKFL